MVIASKCILLTRCVSGTNIRQPLIHHLIICAPPASEVEVRDADSERKRKGFVAGLNKIGKINKE